MENGRKTNTVVILSNSYQPSTGPKMNTNGATEANSFAGFKNVGCPYASYSCYISLLEENFNISLASIGVVSEK